MKRSVRLPKLPVAALAAFALLAACEGVFLDDPRWVRLLHAQTKPGGLDNPIRADLGLRLARLSPAEPKIIVLGPSNAREGVGVRALNRRYRSGGARFFNLAVYAFQLTDLYQMRGRLAAAKPDVVLCILTPHIFFRPNELEQKGKILFDPSILPVLVRWLGWQGLWSQREVALEGTLGWASRTFRYRELLRRVSDEVAAGKQMRKTPDLYHYTDVLSDRAFRKVLRKYRKRDYYGEYPETPMQEALLEPSVRALTESGARVYLIPLPHHPETRQMYRAEYEERFLRRLEELTAVLPVRYIEPERLPVFESADYLDPVHLGPSGRKKLTRFLAALLEEDGVVPPVST